MQFLGLGVHPGDALLEAAAGADISIDLCHAPEFTLMQRLPQQGSVPQIGVFHTPRLWNEKKVPKRGAMGHPSVGRLEPALLMKVLVFVQPSKSTSPVSVQTMILEVWI